LRKLILCPPHALTVRDGEITRHRVVRDVRRVRVSVNVHRPLVSRRVGVSRTDVSALEVFELGGDVQSIRRGRHDEGVFSRDVFDGRAVDV